MTKKYKNLYINGCSFTKGDILKANKAFPWKLNELLETTLYDFSKNGNSLEAIAFTTTHHLLDFSPDDTLVVIGLTWSPRSAVLLNGRIFNITPADMPPRTSDKTTFSDKNTPGRFSLPFENPKNILGDSNPIEDQQIVNEVLHKYVQYKKSIIQYDKSIEDTFNYMYLYTLLNLQNFLVVNGFNYLFVDFSGVVTKQTLEFKTNTALDHSKIVPMYKDLHESFTIDPSTSHPTAEATTFLANYILNYYI